MRRKMADHRFTDCQNPAKRRVIRFPQTLLADYPRGHWNYCLFRSIQGLRSRIRLTAALSTMGLETLIWTVVKIAQAIKDLKGE